MKNEYKHIFDKIEPDKELENQILTAKSSNKRIKFDFKKAIAAAAAFALIITAGAFYSVSNTSESGKVVSSSAVALKSDFQIIAYAKDGKTEPKEITENDITLMDYKLTLKKDSDGKYTLRGSSQSDGLAIKSDSDIESVTFECGNGDFLYFDYPLREKMIRENKYYSAIIPITEEEYKAYRSKVEESGDSEEKLTYKYEFIKNILESKDCSGYIYDDDFDAEKLSSGAYSADITDEGGEEEKNYNCCILIESKKKTENIYINDVKTLTAKKYQASDEIKGIYYTPSDAENYLINNPDTAYEDLPGDEIKITVKYKNGQTASKRVLTSFNKSGELTMTIE